MTNFVKEHFDWDGMYLMYQPNGFTEGENGYRYLPNKDMKFVARFKHGSKPWKGWVSFMVKNFTVEEYFNRLDAGEGPLTVMESKGYLLPHIKKWLKRDGYPATQEGYKAWREARRAA